VGWLSRLLRGVAKSAPGASRERERERRKQPEPEPEPEVDEDRERELEPETDVVELPIEDAIDLHPFQPREIADVVAAYLDAAWERGFEEVRIIHGRGIGQQRRTVRRLLERDPRIASFTDAGPERGGWGATVARFVPRQSPPGDPQSRPNPPSS